MRSGFDFRLLPVNILVTRECEIENIFPHLSTRRSKEQLWPAWNIKLSAKNLKSTQVSNPCHIYGLLFYEEMNTVGIWGYLWGHSVWSAGCLAVDLIQPQWLFSLTFELKQHFQRCLVRLTSRIKLKQRHSMVPNDSGYNFVVMAFLSTSLIAVVNGQKKLF